MVRRRLADIEIAVLLLEAGRAAKVKAMAAEVVEVFESEGVHREALAALRLFHEAAEREDASTELARRILRYLFRARHDNKLQLSGRKARVRVSGKSEIIPRCAAWPLFSSC